MPEDPHILLVDDERDIREPLAAFIARNGYRVSKASDAAAARPLPKRWEPWRPWYRRGIQ
jgi:DNA-binding response OmpR family regulator